MNTQYPDVPWIDPNHLTNREKIPQEELDQYAGQFVAYSWDGTHIVAGADSEAALMAKLKELGISTQQVVFSYIDSI